MAGSKRTKIKQKAHELVESISPTVSPPAPEDDDLLDDLLAQIDHGSPVERMEATKVLAAVETKQEELLKAKRDPKKRHQERQVRGGCLPRKLSLTVDQGAKSGCIGDELWAR